MLGTVSHFLQVSSPPPAAVTPLLLTKSAMKHLAQTAAPDVRESPSVPINCISPGLNSFTEVGGSFDRPTEIYQSYSVSQRKYIL